MLIKNTARRLITINTPQIHQKNGNGDILNISQGRKYNLLPAGKAVDVPAEACRLKAKFLYALLKIREVEFDVNELDELTGGDPDAVNDEPFVVPEQFEGLSKSELTEMAESMGLVVAKRWTIENIITAIVDIEGVEDNE